MKLRNVIAGLSILAAGTGAVLLAGKGESPDGGNVKPVVAEVVRAAALPGLCPSTASRDPAECKQSIQLDAGRCLCFTAQAENVIDNETTSTAVALEPPSKRKRLVVCEVDTLDPKTDKPIGKRLDARWETEDQPLCVGGIVAVKNIPLAGISMSNMETGAEAQLRTLCPECSSRITAGNWGACPYCAHPSYLGGCKAACPAVK